MQTQGQRASHHSYTQLEPARYNMPDELESCNQIKREVELKGSNLCADIGLLLHWL
jgi:hypothetical protein